MKRINTYITEEIRKTLKDRMLDFLNTSDDNEAVLSFLRAEQRKGFDAQIDKETLSEFSEFKGLGAISGKTSDDIFSQLKNAFYKNGEYKSFLNIVNNTKDGDNWGIVPFYKSKGNKDFLLDKTAGISKGNLINMCKTTIKTSNGEDLPISFAKTAKEAMNMHGACNGGGELGPGEILIRFILKEPINGKATDGDVVLAGEGMPKVEVKGCAKNSGGHPQCIISEPIGYLYYDFEDVFYNSVSDNKKDDVGKFLDKINKTSPKTRKGYKDVSVSGSDRNPYAYLQETKCTGLTSVLEFIKNEGANMKDVYTKLFSLIFSFSNGGKKIFEDIDVIDACTDYCLSKTNNLGNAVLNCTGILQYYIYQQNHKWTHLMVVSNDGANIGDYVIIEWKDITKEKIEEILKYISFGTLDGASQTDRNCTGKMILNK